MSCQTLDTNVKRVPTVKLPLFGLIFPAPVAAKVPETIFLFWVVKILTTAGGEATSDYLKTWGNIKGGGTEVGLFLVALVLQFATRRYQAFAYWSLAFAIAIFGTGVSDFLHLDVHIPYAGTTLLWAVILAAVFWLWQRNEGTLSIHSITTQRARGLLLGDGLCHLRARHGARRLHGHLAQSRLPGSGILFSVVILILPPRDCALWVQSHRCLLGRLRAHATLGRVLRRLHLETTGLSGIGFGDGPTAVVFAAAVFVLVAYLSFTRPDIQGPQVKSPRI